MRRAVKVIVTPIACRLAVTLNTANRQAMLCAIVIALLTTSTFATEPTERALAPEDREHWAFQPIVRPAVPSVDDAAHPIDAFINARLREAGLQSVGLADRETLLRRVTFDLTGLPPTIAEMDAFLADQSPEAWERVVDRLLASTAYGERWAQHWLDLARFAETDGFEHDLPRPQAWRYRDWVIQALCDDLPFDQFVRLQIAGDLLVESLESRAESQKSSIGSGSSPALDSRLSTLDSLDSRAALIATGFLLCGPDMPDINNQDERRHVVLNEMTATVGEVLLGLQVGCAQCHDHKTDPISQFDFYRLRAFFDSGDIFQEHTIATATERAAYQAELAKRGETACPAEAELKKLDDTARQRLREQNPDLLANADNLKSVLTPQELARQRELKQQLAKLPPVPELPRGRVFRDGKPRTAHLYARGDFRRPVADVEPAFLRIASPVSRSLPSDRDTISRIELADWLVSSDNPLVTRVLVNRVWQFHFGAGLVRTPSDFGFGGSDPTHPELLDWLATELPRQGWSVKSLHKLIVTSETYRRAARPPGSPGTAVPGSPWSELIARDPENRLWGRRSLIRLEGEAIRDAMLAAADRLSPRRGGPGVRPPLPPELVGTLLKNQWNISPDEEDHRRRSIYLFVRRNLRYPLFEVFDRPDTNQSCPIRARSTVAPQSLALMNGELPAELATQLATLLEREHPDSPTNQVRDAFRRCLGRSPTAGELERSLAFARTAGLNSVCRALFNVNEFVYVD